MCASQSKTGKLLVSIRVPPYNRSSAPSVRTSRAASGRRRDGPCLGFTSSRNGAGSGAPLLLQPEIFVRRQVAVLRERRDDLLEIVGDPGPLNCRRGGHGGLRI